MTPRQPTDNERAILKAIKGITRKIHRHEQALAELYEQRVVLYEEGRAVTPKPIPQARMAEAAGVSEVAVIQALQKRRTRAAAVVERAKAAVG